MSPGTRGTKAKAEPPLVLVFGEDDHDRQVLVRLIAALAPSAPRAQARRAPLVLQKGQTQAAAKKNLCDIAGQVRIDQAARPIPFVVAHRDCDDLEPAHVVLSEQIERGLAEQGVTAAAATPAWEMETWLLLWPDAFPAVVAAWSRPRRDGTDLGRLRNAKEALRRDLRGRLRPPPRDYTEADAVRVVEKAIEKGLIAHPSAQSASFDRFRARLIAVASAA